MEEMIKKILLEEPAYINAYNNNEYITRTINMVAKEASQFSGDDLELYLKVTIIALFIHNAAGYSKLLDIISTSGNEELIHKAKLAMESIPDVYAVHTDKTSFEEETDAETD